MPVSGTTARRITLGLMFPALVLALWEILARAGVLSADGFSSIGRILPAAVQQLADGTMLQRTWETLSASAVGWAMAAAIGIPLGLLLGLAPPLERLLSVTIEALRPVPSAALIPIALLIFGFGLQMSAAVAAFAASGRSSSSPRLRRAASSRDCSNWHARSVSGRRRVCGVSRCRQRCRESRSDCASRWASRSW